jgi:hypothetical protein
MEVERSIKEVLNEKECYGCQLQWRQPSVGAQQAIPPDYSNACSSFPHPAENI